MLHPLSTGEQALPLCEVRRRQALPGIPAGSSQAWVPSRAPFRQGSQVQDDHHRTTDLSSGRPVLRAVVDEEKT